MGTIFSGLLYDFTIGLILDYTKGDGITLGTPGTTTTLVMFYFKVILGVFLSSLSLGLFGLFGRHGIGTTLVGSMTI